MICSWCKTDSSKMQSTLSPHSTWCPHYRRPPMPNIPIFYGSIRSGKREQMIRQIPQGEYQIRGHEVKEFYIDEICDVDWSTMDRAWKSIRFHGGNMADNTTKTTKEKIDERISQYNVKIAELTAYVEKLKNALVLLETSPGIEALIDLKFSKGLFE